MCNDLSFNVADIKQVQNRVDELRHRSDDIKSRLAKPLKLLWNPERKLKMLSKPVDFTSLRQNFPQFSEVINYYENTIISLDKIGLPFEVSPVLLLGNPGLGKTYFASELSKCLQLPFFEISLATMSASFALSGSNIQWSEGQPGFIANTIAESAYANPVILIDEIDKAQHGNRFNPMNVFYSLLEPHSARRFKDEALEIELDASRVIWIATGNYIDEIPEPIQSRMRTFHIKQPNTKDMANVIDSIYRFILSQKSYGKLLAPSLDESVITQLSAESPRSIRLAIEEASFKAIRHERRTIVVSDLPKIKKEKQRVGFI